MKALAKEKNEKRLAEREGIQALQDLMCDIPEEDKFDINEMTEHFFAPGIYARMIFIPAGGVVVGKIHKHETMNIICKGKIAVATEDGKIVVEGPCVINSSPGIKKAGYAIEDTWWINIHATDETNLDKIEEEFIAKDYEETDTLRIEGE